MKIAVNSNIGSREKNEDSFYLSEDQSFVILADGMGGHVAGEKASEIAVEVVASKLVADFQDASILKEAMEDAIREANHEIYRLSQEHLEYRGMGTTISLVYFFEDQLIYVNIGDSRIYIESQSGFEQISEDDSFVNYLVTIGDISKEEARVHPKKNILTKALGTTDSLEFTIESRSAEDVKKILLCSDGLSDVMNDEEIEKILQKKKLKVEEKIDALIENALEAGSTDNITVILADRKKVNPQ